MGVGRLRSMGRSFCCTRKYQKGRKWRKSESKGRNLLNTDLQNIHIKTVTGLTGPDGAGSIAYPDGFTMLNAHILSAKIRFTNSEYYVFPYINADMFSDRIYIYFQYGENKISFNFGKNFANTTLEVVLAKFGV